MMNRQAEISEKDMTLLCEYLDDAMSIKDRAKFEKRLQQSPELKQALEDMTALKLGMRSLPVRKVPHQFTLTRGEAEKARRGRFLLSSFGWASVVSMILLAVIFGSEFIFSNFSAPQPAYEEPVTMMLENEAATESVMKQAEEEDAQPVYLLNWVSVGGKGGGGAGGIGGGGSITGDFMVGLGGGPVETYAEDAVAEPLQAEDLLEPTEAARMLSEEKITVEPLIFGVREDQLGQVIAVQPDEAPVPSITALREGVEAEKEPLIATNIKLILAGLAAIFGLIWLLLRFKR
jgi:hypothetical protein